LNTVFKTGTPEEVGIASEDIQAFIERLEEEGLYMHSVLVIRNGKLVTEGYYKPYTRETKHRLYSASKSFVSGAVGLLIDEGLLQLSDRVHTFFPEIPEKELHPYIRETTVENLLTMSSPHTTTYSLCPEDAYFGRWAESFFRTPPLRPAGTVFRYDTSASYILDVIVERITGKPFLEYMKEKMLRKLGFSEDAFCIESPEGYAWGGSGVICTPLDFAKYAYVFLRNGMVNGQRVLSEGYVKAAVSKQVSNDSFGYGRPFTNSGYGYQIWCMPEDGWAFNGMGCQLAYAIPEKDLLFVCTACNNGRPEAEYFIFDAFLDGIAKRCKEKPLQENRTAHTALLRMLENLKLHGPKGEAHSSWEEKIQGVTYVLDDNLMGWKWVRFEYDGEEGTLHYENRRGRKKICFGLGRYKEFTFPETQYCGRRVGTPKGEGYRCLGTGVWVEENRLLLRINAIDDYLGNLGITFGFKEAYVGITAEKAAEGFWDDYKGFAGGIRETL